MTGQSVNSPLASGEWYQFEVRETGMYKLDQKFFSDARISLPQTINSIRIFGNGGKELSEDLAAPRPNGLEEIARHIVDNNGNGIFDADDYVVFFGMSTRGWVYNSVSKSWNHYINHYSEQNYYFLTFGGVTGRQMDSVAASPVGTPVRELQDRLFVEQEKFNLIGSGRQWVGQLFDNLENTGVYFNTLSGFVSSQPIVYKISVLSASSTVDTFRVYETNDLLGNPIILSTVDVGPGGLEGDAAYFAPIATFSRPPASLENDRSAFKLVFGARNQSAKGWLDWFEIHYTRSLKAVNDFLFFASPDTSGNIAYEVTNLSSLPSRNAMVFDVTDHKSVRRLVQLSFDPVISTLVRFQVSQAGVKEFAVVGANGFKTPVNPRQIVNSNVHGITPGAHFIILSPPEFVNEAARLKAHRESSDTLKAAVVRIDQVFNEFSGGLTDPMAVRDFLKYALTNWSMKPAYILLFGGGHYDYKSIISTARNWIPPYESVESNNRVGSHASDDYFVILNQGNPRVTIAAGRLPARSSAEAVSMVDKIIAYETTVPFDPWRNRVTFVADDGLTSTSDDGSLHTGQAEDLAQNHTPASFEKKKIYLIEYPTVSSATGRRKPEVNRDIVAAVNRGTLILNYTGHGNEKLWAHEAVFTREGEIAQLTNKDKLTLVVAATCNYAQYDDPLEQSAGEVLLAMNQGGAIGVVTASRVVYSFENAQLNNKLYDSLFQTDAQGRPKRLGDAMWKTKQSLFSTNDLKYHLLADPTARLNFPRATASVDSVNGSATSLVVAMQSLGRITVKGNIRRPDGSVRTSFNGRGVLEALDSRRRVVVNEWGGFSFEVNGSLLYRGEISITNGAFQGIFPLPKDVSYGTRSRISLYAWNDSTDAAGFTENVTITGSDSSAAPDTSGPVVSVFFDDLSFRSGDVIKPDATLIVDLFDQNGINTSIAGVGHRLEATLSLSAGQAGGQSGALDLTDFYRSGLDTYQSGQVRYPIKGLQVG
ncbi:MAG: type IX secretion system sortase PorU [Bacteroidota bacterium]